MSLFGALWADFRFAARTLLRHPGYTLVAVATLAVGIAANAVIFSVTRPILLAPLPFEEPEKLVRVLADNPGANLSGYGFSVGDFVDFRRLATTLQDLSAFRSPRSMALTGGEHPEPVRGCAISPSTLKLLGVKPERGRAFVGGEETIGQNRVVILSDGFWHRHFAGQPNVVGQTLQLDGTAYQVVGVMPESFRYPLPGVDLWLPLALDLSDQNRENRYLHSLARVRPGQTVEQADAEVRRIATLLAREHPDTNAAWTGRAAPFADHLAKPIKPALLVLSVAVGLLLLIACSNLANLLLARGAARSRETAIRAAVGAQARSLVRLFLVESLLLSMVGCLLAIPLAMAGVDLLLANSPEALPRLAEITVNRSVVGFALLLSLVSSLVFGLVPAIQLARPNLAESSREGESGGRRGSGFRSLLVMTEVALALVLLTSASLLFRGFLKLSSASPGFDTRQALALQIDLPVQRYPEDPDQVAFYERLVADLSSLPGVRSAAVGTALPLARQNQSLQPIQIEGGRGVAEELKGVQAAFTAVGPRFFETLRIPLEAGRDIAPRDLAGAPLVAVISEELAKRAFPGQNPLGRKLILNVLRNQPAAYQIIGVVAGVRQLTLADAPAIAVYVPLAQVAYPNAFVVVRTDRDPLSVIESAERRVFAIDSDQPVTRSFPLDQLLVDAGAKSRFFTGLLSLFAGIGLLLSCVGLYGVIAYNVSRRKHEFAVRMAVGASKTDILWMVVRGGLVVTLVGIAVGLVAAFLITGFFRSMLYGLGPRDPSSFLVSPLILLLVALLASYLPARRAMRVDPVSPLRQV